MSLISKKILIITTFVVPLFAFVLHGIYLRLIQGTRLHWFHNESMPHELRSARLLFNETAISAKGLRGQIDQGFRTKKGLLVLVDTKTRSRHQVKREDIEQLSLYAHILRVNNLRNIANYGYVRTVVFINSDHRSVHYHKVALMSSSQVQAQFNF